MLFSHFFIYLVFIASCITWGNTSWMSSICTFIPFFKNFLFTCRLSATSASDQSTVFWDCNKTVDILSQEKSIILSMMMWEDLEFQISLSSSIHIIVEDKLEMLNVKGLWQSLYSFVESLYFHLFIGWLWYKETRAFTIMPNILKQIKCAKIFDIYKKELIKR